MGCLRDPTFSRFRTTLAYDIQTVGHKTTSYIALYSVAR